MPVQFSLGQVEQVSLALVRSGQVGQVSSDQSKLGEDR